MRRNGAVEKKRFGDALFGLNALLQTTTPYPWRLAKIKAISEEATKLAEKFRDNKADAEESTLARQMEALLAQARVDFGDDTTTASKTDWKKWGIVGAGVLGGVLLLRAVAK